MDDAINITTVGPATRGERNCNPGNVDRTNPRTLWQGRTLPDNATRTDPRFETFIHAKWGVRAIVGTLIAYNDKHGINTIRGLINRWAPPMENATSSYVYHVAALTGLPVDAPMDMNDYSTMRQLVMAIITHENGRNSYSAALIDEGLKLAGIITDKPPLIVDTPTGKAAITTASAGVVGVVVTALPSLTAAMQDARPVLDAFSKLAPVVALAIIVAVTGCCLLWRLTQRKDTGV